MSEAYQSCQSRQVQWHCYKVCRLTRSICSTVVISRARMTITFTSGRVSLYQVGPFGRADRGKHSPFELASGIELPQLVDRVVQVDLKYKSGFISIYTAMDIRLHTFTK